jgi:hypothetical protein
MTTIGRRLIATIDHRWSIPIINHRHHLLLFYLRQYPLAQRPWTTGAQPPYRGLNLPTGLILHHPPAYPLVTSGTFHLTACMSHPKESFTPFHPTILPTLYAGTYIAPATMLNRSINSYYLPLMRKLVQKASILLSVRGLFSGCRRGGRVWMMQPSKKGDAVLEPPFDLEFSGGFLYVE